MLFSHLNSHPGHTSPLVNLRDLTIPLDPSRFARVSTGDDNDFGCARTNIVYIMSKPNSNIEVNHYNVQALLMYKCS